MRLSRRGCHHEAIRWQFQPCEVPGGGRRLPGGTSAPFGDRACAERGQRRVWSPRELPFLAGPSGTVTGCPLVRDIHRATATSPGHLCAPATRDGAVGLVSPSPSLWGTGWEEDADEASRDKDNGDKDMPRSPGDAVHNGGAPTDKPTGTETTTGLRCPPASSHQRGGQKATGEPPKPPKSGPSAPVSPPQVPAMPGTSPCSLPAPIVSPGPAGAPGHPRGDTGTSGDAAPGGPPVRSRSAAEAAAGFFFGFLPFFWLFFF